LRTEKLNLCPLSYAQQRLWFLDQLEPDSPLYNVPFALRFRGDLQLNLLQAVFQELVRRHEALRTNFQSDHGEPVQRIRPAAEFKLGWVDYSEETGTSEPLETVLSREARRPFRLAEDGLMRGTVYRLGKREHVLLVCLHHIICDEWSLGVLFGEILQLYEAFSKGQPSPLAELPIQYADYAVWQRERLQGPVLDQELAYWRERLRQSPSRLSLPCDRVPPTLSSHAGARQSAQLPQELADALRDLSRRHNVSVFMALLAAFKGLLHRYTHQDDLTVGSPIAGRTRLETEGLIGFFVNTLVLRTDLSGDPSFVELLRRVRETTLGAYEHSELPFDKLVEALHPDRNTRQTPLIQVVFSLEHAIEGARSSDLEFEPLEVSTHTSKFDLTWVIIEQGAQLRSCVEYATELFDPETMRFWLSHWHTFLQEITTFPERPLSRLSVTSVREREQLLVQWNQTCREFPENRTLSGLFEDQVRAHPERIAVRFGTEEMTYAALNARANQVAATLRAGGAGLGKAVVLCAERSINLIVGILAVVKAGGVYIPIEPGCPAERLSLLLEETSAPVILTEEHLRPNLPRTTATILSLQGAPNPFVSDGPDLGAGTGLAYVIYTSGSTGRPKGVAVSQRAIIRLVCGTDYVQLTPEDRVAQASTPAFDAATFEIWGALLNGATLVGVPRDLLLSPKEFAAFLQEERITTLFVTTALFNQFASDAPDAFRSLKQLLFGGEAVDPKWVRRVLRQGPPKRLLHVYGPTETTTFATWHEIKEVPPEAKTIPIGRPIANTRLYLLDRWLNPVGIGMPGEIFIGGPGVAQGYFNQPELTAERFIPDPFDRNQAAKLYRTGDLGRFRPDGSLEFLGRFDNQVKLRGYRIELGEIEAALAKHPAVRESAVTVLPADDASGKRLAAYLVLRDGYGPGTIRDVRQHLKESLPGYMVPALFLPLEALPLNPHGKVDRRALPFPEQSALLFQEHYAEPKNPVEEQLAAIWSELLGVEQVGREDDFFELGGHSLLAVRLFGKIETRFGKKLPLATLFQSPTVERLARLIGQDETEPAWPLIVDIQPSGTRPPIFWVHSLGGDGGGAFFYYRKLSQLLGPDQPSLGIRSPRQPFTSIPQMAVSYVDELLRFRPKGPYFLGGFCFGGIVAYEMARELEARGCPVDLLVLLESAAPVAPKAEWNKAAWRTLAGNLRSWAAESLRQEPRELLSRGWRKILSRLQKTGRRLRHGPTHVAAPDLGELIDMAEYPKDYVRYAQAHWEALQDYRPRSYGGFLTLFRARKQRLLNLDPTLGWGRLAQGGVAVNIIPGNHEQMLKEPNVRILADELRACLAEAQPELNTVDDPAEAQPDFQATTPVSWPCSIIT
jgi:amino acid adenylation domain-containing protein